MGRKQSKFAAEVAWRERLPRFDDSNLTVKQFCRQEGVSKRCAPGPRDGHCRYAVRPMRRTGLHAQRRLPTVICWVSRLPPM
jgi:hypothetical protein